VRSTFAQRMMASRPSSAAISPMPSGQCDYHVNSKPAGPLENAQAMAAHESPRTTKTKLYDRTGDEITLDEVERITI
jgi:hypothetical protein